MPEFRIPMKGYSQVSRKHFDDVGKKAGIDVERIGTGPNEILRISGSKQKLTKWTKMINQSESKITEVLDIAKLKTQQHKLLPINWTKYKKRAGLEGPFMTKSGQVVYFDKIKGQYYNPDNDMYLSYGEWKKLSEDAPVNATGTAVAGSGDDSSTVVVKKKKPLQDKLMRRLKIKESIDRAVPDLEYPKDKITERKQQLIDMARKKFDITEVTKMRSSPEIRELEFTFSNEQQAKKAEAWIEKSEWQSITGGTQDLEQHKNTVWMGGITDPGGLEKALKQSGFKFKISHVDNRYIPD